MINFNQIRSCNKCSIRCNQQPLIQKRKSSKIIWVGLSAVSATKLFDEEPLSKFTRSGALINDIEEMYDKASFYRTNLVKCLPLDKSGKIRYPNKEEIENCIEYLEMEIKYFKPEIVFLLGKMVAKSVLKKFVDVSYSALNKDFEYEEFKDHQDVKFIPIHHPSYMLIYKRKYIDNYKHQLRKKIASS